MASTRDRPPRLVGVLHLPPLPGAPRASRDARTVVAAACAQAIEEVDALSRAGFDGVIVENFGDAPFVPGEVDAITIAAMSCIVATVCDHARGMQVGVNVLRNDARAAIAIAAAAGASFVRVNVHVGAVVADQGVIEGRAYETMRLRKSWGADAIAVWADVDVKHAVGLGPRGVDLAHDAIGRGLADALLVTGKATGSPADPASIATLHGALPAVPLYVASGATPDTLEALATAGAYGVVVGSFLRAEGRAGGRVDARRSATFAEAFRAAFR